ncbi:MAG: ribosome small subunit-dependent GTPase A [Bacteroidetes bacterium]|nr:ribosome small subunit-dependent GTPase A [Bacteroidota bacterium]
MHTGTVIRSTGAWLDVLVGEKVISSRIRGRMRLDHEDSTQPITVGDRVSLMIQKDETGLITEVHQRYNCLHRRAAGRKVRKRQILVANVDFIWIVQAAKQPALNWRLVDRLLIACEAQDIPAGLVINKMDLATPDLSVSIRELGERYRQLGYPVVLTSVEEHINLDALCDLLSGKISVLLGPSGVGKSSLLNAIDPTVNIPTKSVSKKTNKGRHTTAHTELYSLTTGGNVMDTPGIREFGLLDIKPWELAHHCPEFRPHLTRCRFPACTHDHEPDCAVKRAHMMERISDERYKSYLNILYTLHLGDADIRR